MGEAVFLLYAAAALAIGVKAKAKTLETFILGDELNTRTMVATVVSTFYGASAILGGVGLTYQLGLGALWFMAPFYLGNLAVLLLLARITGSKSYTLPDFLGGFYGRSFAVASALLLTTLCLVPEEIIAGGKILATFTSMPVDAAMVIMAIVLIAPVALGGMRADVTTDVIQFGLMVLMLAMLAPFILIVDQPVREMMNAPPEYLNPFAFLSLQEIGVFCILLFFLPITSAPLYQRFFVSESKSSAKRSVLYAIAIWMLIDLVVVLAGFAALKRFPNLSDPDMSLIQLGVTLPGAARGVFFVGLLAAMMSTVNSFLQSGASSLAYDVCRHVWPRSGADRLLALSRIFVVALGVLSLALALWFQMIVPALMFTLSLWTAGILTPTLAALMGWRLSERGALFSLASGVLGSLAWEVFQPFDIDALFIGLGCALLAALISKSLPRLFEEGGTDSG